MEKHELGQQLRQRQYDAGYVERKIVDLLSDDDVIDSYITCSGCGHKQVDEQQLLFAIGAAQDADDFFRICDEIGAPHHHGLN